MRALPIPGPLSLIALSVFIATAGCDDRRSGYVSWEGCADVCNELVTICSYDAFPTNESCIEGCEFEDDRGGDMNGLDRCIGDAGCDTFELLACQRAFGWGSSEEDE